MTKIIELKSSNVKRLKAVEVRPDPDGSLVVVGGNNGEGKSSLMDSILYAIAGTRNIPGMPVRDGEAEAKIEIDLGEYRVTRTIAEDGKSKLRVSMGAGAKVARPQEFLNGLIGSLSFDPEEFARMEPRKQRDLLVSLSGAETDQIDTDIANLQGQLTQERAVFNAAKQQLDALQEPEADPNFDLVDVMELTTTLDVIRQRAALAAQNRNDQDMARTSIAQWRADIERLQQRISQAETDLLDLVESGTTLESQASELGNPEEIRNRIATAEQQNEDIRAAQRYAEVEENVTEKRVVVDELAMLLSEAKEQRLTIIEQVEMPIEGLGFDEKQVTFDGLPFEQLASSEQLRVSMAMAMAMNPELRVIRIMNGALLDDNSLAIVEELAAEKDYQVWVEVVGDHEKASVIIEDGGVKR